MDLLQGAAEVAAILAVGVPSAIWAWKRLAKYRQERQEEREVAGLRMQALEQRLSRVADAVSFLQVQERSLSTSDGNLGAHLSELDDQLSQLNQAMKSLEKATTKGLTENVKDGVTLNEALIETHKDIQRIVTQAMKDKQGTDAAIARLGAQVSGLFETVNKLLEWANRDAVATKAPDMNGRHQEDGAAR